jgi:hypothetical protein
METIMGIHPEAILATVLAFVFLTAVRLAVRSLLPERVALAAAPDPEHDEHEAFPDDSNVVDLAAFRARVSEPGGTLEPWTR